MFFNPVENILDPDAKFIFCVQLTWKTLQITDILPFLQSLVPADAVWSRGDNGRPARAHMVVIRARKIAETTRSPDAIRRLHSHFINFIKFTINL